MIRIVIIIMIILMSAPSAASPLDSVLRPVLTTPRCRIPSPGSVAVSCESPSCDRSPRLRLAVHATHLQHRRRQCW